MKELNNGTSEQWQKEKITYSIWFQQIHIICIRLKLKKKRIGIMLFKILWGEKYSIGYLENVREKYVEQKNPMQNLLEKVMK